MTKSLRLLAAVTAAALICAGLLETRPAAPQSALAGPTKKAAAAPALASVVIRDVPHIAQEPDFCGEACAAMYLRKLGFAYDQDGVFNAAGLDPSLARGCWARELNAALTKIGFGTGPVWFRVAADDAQNQLDSQWQALHADLAAGIPSIICMHYDQREGSSEHFRLILGYDAQRDEVLYHEPAAKDGAYQRMARATLLSLWPLKYSEQTWTVIRMRLAPGQIAAPPAIEGHSDAQFAQHMMELKKQVPAKGFHVFIEKPFVVIGDGDEAGVRDRAKNTVRWAVDLLKKDYFTKDPKEIIDVWLFKDKKSYMHNTEAIFGDTPDTPYGYYSPKDDALIMNISTGGGTLVHEIVHPFIATNFPQCPSWFNEGLASLYEQSGSRDGHIIGRTNWRLAGLQRAIRAGSVSPFKDLCGTTTREFYADGRGVNYAQARYLCYYLQEQGKLHEFYQKFSHDVAADPTGYNSLVAVLGEKDMAAFKQRWQKWVLELEYE